MNIRYLPKFFVAATLAIVTTRWASAQHGDVWLSTDVANDKLAVGVVDEAGTTFTPGVRVFEAILTLDSLPFSPFDYSAADPGFLSAAGDLPASQPVSLTPAALSIWNGVDLEPVFSVDFHFDLSGGFLTSASGGIHEHPPFGLMDLSLAPRILPDGAYVAAFRAGTAGLDDSDLIHFVMLKDELIADETDVEELEELLEAFENGGPEPVFEGKNFAFFEEAVEFVEGRVPEPSGVAIAGGAALALFAARSRHV